MNAPANAHPFAALVAPLRYACQRDFAQLSTVKDLRPLLEEAIASGKKKGVPGQFLHALSVELPQVDVSAMEQRKASLRRIVGVLRAAGVLPSLPVVAHGVPAPSVGSPPGETLKVRNRGTVQNASGRKAEARTPARRGVARRDTAQRDMQGGASTSLRYAQDERGGNPSTLIKNLGKRLNPRLIGAMNKRGMSKVIDVLSLLPRIYEDRRQLLSISELVPGERASVVGTVRAAGDVPVRNGKRCFRAQIADSTGSLWATYFMTGPWLKARFPLGKRLLLSGEVRFNYSGREMAHPEIEPADDLESSSVHFQRIVPVYPGFERHEQRAFRELAALVASQYAQSMEDPLPGQMLGRLGLVGLAEALQRIHFPEGDDSLEALNAHQSEYHRRLAFDELFFLQLGIALRRQGVKTQQGWAFDVSEERIDNAKALLPFQLTRAQQRVVEDLRKDMGKPEPMNRLLQGDVGSGKTAVALMSAMVALQAGFQVALMAPTEILAEQHRKTFERWLASTPYRVGAVTASGTATSRKRIREQIATHQIHLAVGTHALIQDTVEFQKLGLVIIDEQHRFGVLQRHTLMRKGLMPDVLVMTATPIPRTLAMTLYGDLDVSLIDELPPGRTPIETRAFLEKQRDWVYQAMAGELDAGRQAYVVYPLVEESEKIDLADATQGAQTIQARFPQYKVGLLHGRMKHDEKDAVMREFSAGRTQILVCTTVVEVGVDVPNASVMIIEAAERFGLSQLHQLRGRVGRGAARSFCYLVSNYARSELAADRLSVMEQSTDGFVIAEKDLELRGPGEFLGTRQSGMPELTVANLARDGALLVCAREEARAILRADPELRQPEHAGLVRALAEKWEGRLALARVG